MPDHFRVEDFMLPGRRALVTGGAAGIGAAIARALAAAGADIAVTHRSHEPAELMREASDLGRAFHAVRADFASLDEEGAEAIVADVVERLGGLDILVNNVGVIHRAPAAEHEFADWRKVMAIGLDATFLVTRAAGRHMLAQSFGRIINMGSVLSFQGGVLVPSYAASKHALVGLTRALCNEWALSAVTVNAIAPGYIETDMTSGLRDDQRRAEEILSRVPAGRWGTPRDIAGAAVFLASDAAGFVNGHTLVVDGGWLAR